MSGQRFMTESDGREKDASLRALVEAAKLREENATLRRQLAEAREQARDMADNFLIALGDGDDAYSPAWKQQIADARAILAEKGEPDADA